MRIPERIDPDTCGCTDCLTGYSVPLNQSRDIDILRMAHGLIKNATGITIVKTTTYQVGNKSVTEVTNWE